MKASCWGTAKICLSASPGLCKIFCKGVGLAIDALLETLLLCFDVGRLYPDNRKAMLVCFVVLLLLS